MRWSQRGQRQEQPLIWHCRVCNERFPSLLAAYDHARQTEHPLGDAEVPEESLAISELQA